MAYVSKETATRIKAQIKPLLKKYGVKATVSIENHSVVNLNIQSAPFNLLKSGRSHEQISQYAVRDYAGIAGEFLQEAFAIMNGGNYNNSDLMTDYYEVGWFVYINAGRYDRPFILTD